ncbi:Transglutaminase-like superfamily protein [Pedococcus dokdonensis]|uniref:Transglutaminase-like superfamily protein n=1 Tax=Pedococcus dokdonensis TaxID=443156 RepID=A0A1H0R1Y0_9MICO|nr:transglutaminase domain-containing protein [Pedococcus dokdonensis]SDP23139.1 Transglutaminase-like superfamily protein [Pedococcus dokdonensis]
MTRPLAARLLWCVALLTTAALAFTPAYSGRLLGLPVLAPLVVLATCVAGLLAVATAALRLPRWSAALATSILTTVALSLATPDLLDALPRLLTAPRPAPAAAAYLAPVLAVVFVLSVVATLAETRARASAGVPVAVAAALYLLAALLTAGRADGSGLLALVLLVTAVGGWTLLPRSADGGVTRSPRRPRGAAVRAGVAALAAAAVVAPLAALGSPGADAFEPRSLVHTPRQEAQVLSPLPMLPVWADQSDLPLVRVDGTAPGRLVLAVLPDFDGATWSNRGRFTVPGAEPVADLPAGADQLPYSVTVHVDTLTGGWVPSAGHPTSIDLDDLRVDADSGALVSLGGLREGQSYRLSGRVGAADDATLAAAAVPTQALAARYLRTPQLPRAFGDYARTGVAKATSRLEQAVALEELVRSGRAFSPKAPSGSSYAQLTQFLFPSRGSSIGTSEQFAASYVVLARSIGLPSRLVVGLQVPSGASSPVTLTGGDVLAWPEVYFSDLGWVPFDPTPTQTGAARSAPRQEVLDRLGESAKPADDGTDALRPGPGPGAGEEGQRPSVTHRLALLGSGLGALVLLGLLVLAVGRTRRRTRLRRLGALGAWQHQVDALVLAGTPPRGPESAADVTARITATHPRLAESGLPVSLLERAERAAYAPTTPDAHTSPPPAAPGSDDSWAQAVAITTAIRRAAPWWRRAVWHLDPRVLRGRRSR